MPRSLYRNAGRLLNCAAFRASSLGNVSNDPPTAMSVSIQNRHVGSRLLIVTLRPSRSSHTDSACVPYITTDRKSYKSRLDRPEPVGGYQLVSMRKRRPT